MANSLPHEEAIDGFLLPHHLDNLPVQVDKEGSPKATSNAGEGRSTSIEEGLLMEASLLSAPPTPQFLTQ